MKEKHQMVVSKAKRNKDGEDRNGWKYDFFFQNIRAMT